MKGLGKYAVVDHPQHGTVYAYETDGLGNYNFMDDVNVPSPLSAPYLGYAAADDEVILTRRLILSETNPYYYKGTQAQGIGSPHTPPRYVLAYCLSDQD